MFKKIFIFCLLFGFEVLASEPKYFVDESGIYLVDCDTQKLTEMFQDLYYDTYINPEGNEYPRIFVKNIPEDFALQTDKTERNRIFMKILIPLVLKINEEILDERETIEAIEYDFEQTKDFDKADRYYIDNLAQKYDVVTPYKDTRKYIRLLNGLKKKIDVVPPSIVVAAAAIYTDWGTSRIAVQANNLFKAKVWFEEEGLEPVEDKEDGYKYKIYPSLEASVRDYVLKINSNVNYETFREIRALSRKNENDLYGKRMDWSMILDSDLQNFAGLLDYTLTYYKLHNIDDAKLEEQYKFEE